MVCFIGGFAVLLLYLLAKLVHELVRERGGRDLPPLCLHFDVNETIMLGDPAGGDTYEESLHKIMAKVAFVRPVPQKSRGKGKWAAWAWHDGSPLDPALRDASAPLPPLLPQQFEDPPGCDRFYNVPELKDAYAKCFASEGSPGIIYKAELERMREMMRWPDGVTRDPRLCSPDGYYTFLPAFFYTLAALKASGRRFSVVVRTFGSDLPQLIEAIEAFATGGHPLHLGLSAPELTIAPDRCWIGRYSRSDGSFTLSADPGGKLGAKKAPAGSSHFPDEGAMVEALQGPRDGPTRMSAVQDDYHWWKAAGYLPSAGKPMWLSRPTSDPSAWRHMFFDDNIHCDEEDSIVAVRVRASEADSSFTPVSGAVTVALHSSAIKKVGTILPVKMEDYFIRQIRVCDANFGEYEWKDRMRVPGGFKTILGLE